MSILRGITRPILQPITRGPLEPGIGKRPRTNLLRWSQAFDNAVWTKSGVTLTSGKTDPLGGTTAFSVVGASGAMQLYQAVAGTVAATLYTPSLYVRRVSGTGTVGLIRPNGTAITDITAQLTTSWQRFEAVEGTENGDGNSYPGLDLGTIGDEVEVAFAQLESGTAATAYIPTTTAPVTVYT